MRDKAYITLNIDNYPSPRVAQYGKKVILNDSFEQDWNWYPFSEMQKDKPIKQSSTITYFVLLDGEVNTTKNMVEFDLHSGDVIVNASGVFSVVNNISPHAKFFFIAVDEDFLFSIFSKFDTTQLRDMLINQPMCHLSDIRTRELLQIYKALKYRLNHFQSDPMQEEIVRGYLQAFSFNVYSELLINHRQKRKGSKEKSFRKQEIFANFMKLLKEKYAQEHKINYYADRLCITTRYLSKVVKEVSGQFASEHIDNFVLNESKHLLRSKKYTIMQVSEMLNFSSQSIFCRFFKKLTGYTPKEYMELE
jgi:AraC family transcriptional activator of pobA